MRERKKILWLVSWYPNKLAPYEGDFIQRHARAVAALHDVEVIFVKKDEKGVITNREVEEVNESWPGLVERIIYYNPSKTKVLFLNKILSDTAYRYFYKLAILRYLKLSGNPGAVHLHVAMKAGMLALWLKRKKGMNYILSEHWTGYLPEAKPNIHDFSGWYKTRWKDIVKSASKITVVSNVLGEAIASRFRLDGYEVIPNVVDTNIFFPVESSEKLAPVFIHISSLEEQKDPNQMILAFSLLKRKGYDFSLVIYGPENEIVRNLVHENDLDDRVIFREEVPQTQLAQELQKADALVLFSRYETFGCVVIEANACGVPAILSDLPVFREYSLEGKTAFFADAGNAEMLAEVLAKFIISKAAVDQEEMAEYIKSKFSYEGVAEQFDALYNKV